MKILRRRHSSALTEEGPPPTLSVPASTTPAWIPGPVVVDVAGINHHLEALDVVKRRAATSPLVAVLRPEPTNAYDPHAVAVYLDGMHVGFLHAPVAEHVQAALLEYQRRTGRLIAAPGTIVDHYHGPAVTVSLDPTSLGLTPGDFENLPEMARVLRGLLARLDTPQPHMDRRDDGAQAALAAAEHRREQVDQDHDRSPEAWPRLERDFRRLADRLIAARDPMAGTALLGLARSLRYQAGRSNDTLSAFIESLLYDRATPETWSDLIDYLSIAPHARTLVDLLARCPFQVRRPVLDQLLAIADGQDRNGRMPLAEGVKLRRELLNLCEEQADKAGIALLAGREGLRAEKAGSIEEALALWRKAVSAGGADPHVIDRLSTWLAKQDQYHEAADVLSLALGDPAVSDALRERMQKRLERCHRALST